MIFPLTASMTVFGEESFDQLPLLIGQFVAPYRHKASIVWLVVCSKTTHQSGLLFNRQTLAPSSADGTNNLSIWAVRNANSRCENKADRNEERRVGGRWWRKVLTMLVR